MTIPILVTGGAGYVGSHACKALAQAGYLPIVYDNLVNGHEWAVKWGPFERGDILDAQRLTEVMQRYQPAVVMHFAAFAYVGESVEAPREYYWNNLVGTLTLLDVMRSLESKRIVFSSTCSVYGVPRVLPIDEAHAMAPINPYGASKMAVERCLEDYGRAYGIRSISLRYFNAAGADPDGEIGEDHQPETHLIPLVLAAATGQKPHITVFGTDHGTADGTCIRDYVHVTDIANAHVAALRALERIDGHAAFNLGSGIGISVNQLIEAATRVCGRSIPLRYGARRAGDPPELIASYAKASNELGWSPQLSDIDTILKTAWTWIRSRR